MAIDAAAKGRTARPRAGRRPSPVVEPARGTRLALGLLGVALTTLALAALCSGGKLDASPVTVVGLAIAAAVAERIALPLGPRTWYTPSTPVIVLAGLLAGPVAGAAVGAAAQLGPAGGAWRRRLVQASLGALQGIVAGLVGRWGDPGVAQAVVSVTAALVLAVAVNAAGRVLVLRVRHIAPWPQVWARGLAVDAVDAAIAAPLLAALLVTSETSEALVVAAVAALLAALTIAHGVHRAVTAALAAEERNARHDALTGAPNRLAFEEMLVRQHARTLRGDQPAGVFLVDVDRFKSINDRFGHDAGDDVLAEIVHRLQAGLRATDVVARWGGEELTVLAPGMRSARALERYAERIRVLVRDPPVATRRAAIPVTVSVGGTLLDGSVSVSEAVRRADGAMYEAKRTRDRVVIALPQRMELHMRSA